MRAKPLTRREEAIREVLDQVRAREDLRARRANDPVDFVHRFRTLADRELVALVAANLAFGNVKAIRTKVGDLLERLGPSPAKAADDAAGTRAALDGWKHRVFKGEDVARLLVGARKVQREDGSLGAAFVKALAAADASGATETEAFREALAVFCDRLRVAGGLPLPGTTGKTDRRGPVNLLSNARAGEGAKRLLLFLRWMTRPADGIDLGIWKVPASRLLMPVDVHIHKLSRNLGFTRRNDVSWKTAVEITSALAVRCVGPYAVRLLALPPGDAAAVPVPPGSGAVRGLWRQARVHPMEGTRSVTSRAI